MTEPLPVVAMGSTELAEDEIDAALAVLRSGQLRQGAEVLAFENAFAEFVGVPHAIACSSGTAALHIAFQALLSPGDEVLVPAFTFIATASAVVMAGGVPVLCDVNADDYNLDLEQALCQVTTRTRAACVVPLFGHPIDAVALAEFQQQFSGEVVGDCAQALGSLDPEGRALDATVSAATHSFYPSKNLFVGEGGMITTTEQSRDGQYRLLRSHGRTGPHYHEELGFNYRMSEVEAAIGRCQLPKVERRGKRRQQIAAHYTAELGSLPGVRLPSDAGAATHSYHQYTLRLEPELIDRERFVAGLAEQQIRSAVHYPRGLHQQPALDGRSRQPAALPVTEALCRSVLSIPVHAGLSDDDVERVVVAIRRCAKVGAG